MQNRTSGHLHSLNKKRGVVEFPNYTISWSTHWIPSGFPREWSFEDRAWSSTAIVILALQTTATSEPKSWYPGGQKGESICQTYTTPTVQVRNIVATVGRKSELKAVHGACHLPMTTPRRLYSSGKPTENNAGIGQRNMGAQIMRANAAVLFVPKLFLRWRVLFHISVIQTNDDPNPKSVARTHRLPDCNIPTHNPKLALIYIQNR